MTWELWLVSSLIVHFGLGALAARWIGIKAGDELDWIFVWIWEPVLLFALIGAALSTFRAWRRFRRDLRRLEAVVRRPGEKEEVAQQLIDQTGFGIERIRYGKEE